MKFRIEDSIESLIRSIAGPVEITVQNGGEFTVKGISAEKIEKVRNAVKSHVESQGKVFYEID